MSSELPRKPVVAYYPGDKSTESGALPLTWLWDEYPLAPGSWGNIQAFYDGADSRPLIRKWIDRSTPVANPLPIYRPADAPWPLSPDDKNVRQCYAPTADDIERVRRLFPDHPRPEAPPWDEVATRLILAGHTQPDPAGIRASTLLALLEQIEAAPATSPSPGGSKAPNERGDPYRDVALALHVVVGRRYAKGLSRIIDIARSKATAENRLRQLEKTGLLHPDVSANALAELLDVTDAAVKYTDWWKRRMAKRRSEKAENIENNRSRMLERGRRYERHGADAS